MGGHMNVIETAQDRLTSPADAVPLCTEGGLYIMHAARGSFFLSDWSPAMSALRIAKQALCLAAASLLTLAVSVPSLQAQVLYGSLTGTVTDGTGSAIPGAKIAAINATTGFARQSATDDRGTYLMNDLLPGTYEVTISKPSFGTVINKGVGIDINNLRRLDATLQVEQVNQFYR